MKKAAVFVFFVLTFFSCLPDEKQYHYQSKKEGRAIAVRAAPAILLIAEMEQAHNVKTFIQKEAVVFDLVIFSQGEKRIEANITAATNSAGVRLERSNGVKLVYDGAKVWQTPSDLEYRSARFDIFTWQYFFMAPFKFSDPGTQWKAIGEKKLNGQTYDAARLTFEDATGDSPKDWYIAYKSKATNLLECMVYIVTFGSNDAREAEKELRAITYHDYHTVDGVPFPATWKFWLWSEEKGLHTELGTAKVTNIHFVQEENFFKPPKNAKEINF